MYCPRPSPRTAGLFAAAALLLFVCVYGGLVPVTRS